MSENLIPRDGNLTFWIAFVAVKKKGCWLRQLMKALKVHTKALSWQRVPQSLHQLPILCGWDFSGSSQIIDYTAPKTPEVSSSARLLLKSPSPFFIYSFSFCFR